VSIYYSLTLVQRLIVNICLSTVKLLTIISPHVMTSSSCAVVTSMWQQWKRVCQFFLMVHHRWNVLATLVLIHTFLNWTIVFLTIVFPWLKPSDLVESY